MYIVQKLQTGRVRNRPLKDYAGEKFGRLTAEMLVERDLKNNNHLWRYVCDCGQSVALRIKYVRSGHTSSCGCLARETVVARNTKHGLLRSRPREYRSWKDMRARCSNPNNSDYADYGGRGIGFCGRWNSFANFYADMGNRPERATLDRINVNGDYEPGNCRWADAKAQANNKRSNHNISFNGETKTLQQWCDQYGVESSKVRYRLKRGWPFELAFSGSDFRA